MLLLHVHQQVRCALEEFSRFFFFSSKGSHISYKTSSPVNGYEGPINPLRSQLLKEGIRVQQRGRSQPFLFLIPSGLGLFFFNALQTF